MSCRGPSSKRTNSSRRRTVTSALGALRIHSYTDFSRSLTSRLPIYSITGLVKLEDANNAGTKHSSSCTLILTEGDSAKALAVSGLAVVGRDNYGVFPLRGKLLNVREATGKTLVDNAEIQAIKQIMGLQQGKVYQNTESLRYGSLMIMADQVRASNGPSASWEF